MILWCGAFLLHFGHEIAIILPWKKQMFHSLRSNMPPSASAGAMFSCGLPRCLCCFPAHCGSFITAPPLRTRRASVRPLSCCFCRSAGRVLPLVCCCAHFKRLGAAFHNLHSRIFRHGIFDLPRLHPVQIRCFRLQQRDSACGQHRFCCMLYFIYRFAVNTGAKRAKAVAARRYIALIAFAAAAAIVFGKAGF